jgi:hypothetical protein
MTVDAFSAQMAQGYSSGTSYDNAQHLWPIHFGAALPRLVRSVTQISCYIQKVEIEDFLSELGTGGLPRLAGLHQGRFPATPHQVCGMIKTLESG